MNKYTVKDYPPFQFTVFRIIFGLYLFIHFIDLISSSPDIWSQQGMMADTSLNFTHGKFPNILEAFDTPIQIQIFISIMALLALMFGFGIFRIPVAILLWYGWACLFHRNNLISNPGIPMVGWLLLATALIPSGEPLSLKFNKKNEPWGMPSILFYGAWIMAGIAYTISGIDKFMAPSWKDGTAIFHLLNNPLARDSFLRQWLLDLPMPLIYVQTWGALTLEISFGILCLFKRTRLLAWISIMAMHIGILAIVDFADLTIGVMMIHLFTFDPNWFHPKKDKIKKRIVLFDGLCGMCNSSVNLLMSIDMKSKLLFTPLQGETIKTLPLKMDVIPDSIIYFQDDQYYTKSTAVIKVLRDMGGIFSFAIVLFIFPKFIRDTVYDLIAKNRYRIYGRKEECRIPTPEERAKFLD
jgi:predicted DCC family thiol-disulfide oxidoreductase YuxK